MTALTRRQKCLRTRSDKRQFRASYPKIPKWIDVLGFVTGLALLGAAGIGYWLDIFAGHRLEWVAQKGGSILIMNGDDWPSAFVFAAIVLAVAWAAIQIALRGMTIPNVVQQQQPQDPNSSGRSAEQVLEFISGIKL